MIGHTDLDINSMYAHSVNLTPVLAGIKFIKGATVVNSHGESWHDVMCIAPDLADWIRSQPEELWAAVNYVNTPEHMSHFTIHESLFTYLQLRWS